MMKNYFENVNVNWSTWSPKDVIFKSNSLVKKLLPSENILSWKSKNDRDVKMCKRTGCKNFSPNGHPYYSKENYKGVMVQMKEMKTDFPSANIDFIDYTSREDSVGNKQASLDVLVYLNSFHSPWQWKQCPKTHSWQKIYSKNVAPAYEGYRMCYGGQGDSNALGFDEFHELVQITEAVKNFIVEEVLGYNKHTNSVMEEQEEECLIAV